MPYLKAVLRYIIYAHLFLKGVFNLGVVYKPLEPIYLQPDDILHLVDKPDDYRRSKNGAGSFVDGRHRLSIAKILELGKIPVIVTMWHKNYYEEVKIKENKYFLSPKLLSSYLSINR